MSPARLSDDDDTVQCVRAITCSNKAVGAHCSASIAVTSGPPKMKH